MGEPLPDDLIRGQPGNVRSTKPHFSSPCLHKPGDGLEGRGLAGPIRTDERYEFTGPHMQRYPFENMDIAVITMDTPKP
jgi:hypothetical protein